MAHPHQSTALPRRCVVCKGMDAIVLLESCGHAFHSRCIFDWPVLACEVCHTPSDSIALVGRCRSTTNPSSPTSSSTSSPMSTRRNWGDAEHEYCLLLMELFKEGCLPLKQGMHLRQTLAMLLNCNPMRITKKFKQQDTLGKQTYVYHPTPNGANYKRHVQRQKQITTLRDAFYWQLKLHSGQPMEAMREAETEFWIKHLVGFGAMIGQAMSSTIVVPSTPPTPTPMHWEQQPHETAMDVGSAMTIDCTIGLYEPCMSQMEWEVVEELKAQDVDPLPWSGHSLHDEFGDSNDITMGSFFMDRITVDDSIWQC